MWCVAFPHITCELAPPRAQRLRLGTMSNSAHPNDYRLDTTKLPQGGLLLKKAGWRKMRDDGNLRPGSKLMVAMEDSSIAMEVDALFAEADAQAADEARAAADAALAAARLAAGRQARSTSRLSSQSSRSVLVAGKLSNARAEPTERTQGPFDYFPRSPAWLANNNQQRGGGKPQSHAPVRPLTLEQRRFEAQRRLAAQAIASRFQAPLKDPAPSALEFSALASLASLATFVAEPVSGPPPSRRPSGALRTEAWAEGPPAGEPPRPPTERLSKSTAARAAPARPPDRPTSVPGLSSAAPPLRLPSRRAPQDDLFGKGPAEHAAADSKWFREALRHDALPARHVWPTKWTARAPPPPPRAPPAPVYRAAPTLSEPGPTELPGDAPAASSSPGAAAEPASGPASRPRATTRPASAVVSRPSLDATLSQGHRRPGSAAIIRTQ